MSHFKERTEKNCLNCNAEVVGKYCYVCGQENTPPKQSAGHLVKHFFDDITHFDGKFFATLRTLIWRPGALTSEFVRGRKKSYVDPVKMYIFTSAVFFIIFFWLFKADSPVKISGGRRNVNYVAGLDTAKLHKYTLESYKDSAMPRLTAIQLAVAEDMADSLRGISVWGTPYRHYERYEKNQALLPSSGRDNFIKHAFIRKAFLVFTNLENDTGNFAQKVGEKILHSLPQMLFISLPLFALLLKLLYRRRKQFYYTDHGIFSIHLYIFTFISLLVFFALEKIEQKIHWDFIDVLQGFLAVWVFVYLYKAMRLFYGQRRGKTILKFLLLNVMAFFMIIMLTLIFFVISAATVV